MRKKRPTEDMPGVVLFGVKIKDETERYGYVESGVSDRWRLPICRKCGAVVAAIYLHNECHHASESKRQEPNPRDRLAALLAAECMASFTYEENGETWASIGEINLHTLADKLIAAGVRVNPQ